MALTFFVIFNKIKNTYVGLALVNFLLYIAGL